MMTCFGVSYYLFTTQSQLLTTPRKEALQNTGKSALSPFPTVLSILIKQEIISLTLFYLSSANASNLDKAKILSFGKVKL